MESQYYFTRFTHIVSGVKKAFLLPVSFIILLCNNGNAQNYFIKKYNALSASSPYIARNIHEIAGKQFIMSANVYYGSGHASLIKTDSLGNVIFYMQYLPNPSQTSYDSYIDGMETTSDNCYLAIGDYERPPGSVFNRMLMKVNQSGHVIWTKSLGNGSLVSDDDILLRTADDRFILKTDLGSTSFVLSKIDKDGNFFYSTRFNDSASTNNALSVNHIRLTKDNGAVIGGRRATNALLIRVDSLFNPIFSIKYPSYFEMDDVQPTADDGFITVMHDSISYQSSFTVMKTSPSGTPLWATAFTDTSKTIISGTVFENSDQTYYCMVTWKNIHSGYFNYDGAIIKLDYNGNVIDMKDSLDIQYFFEIIKTSDKRYCSLIAKGPVNAYLPAIYTDDSLFSRQFGPCMYKKSSSIGHTNVTPAWSNSTLATFSYIMSPQPVLMYDTTVANNLSACYMCTTPTIPGNITVSGGTAKVCPGETRTYTVPADSGYNFLWSVPAGAHVTSGQWSHIATISFDSAFTASGTLSVAKYNNCGSGPSRTLTINRNNPVATITATGPTTFCSGTNPLTLTAASGTGYIYQWKKGSNNIAGATLQSYVPVSTANAYKVAVTNAAGCQKTSAGISVTVNPLPAATITPQGPTTFCAGGSVVLKANNGTGLSYQWKKGGNNITGATLINYTATTAGTYKVRVTNTNGCSKISAGTVVTINCKTGEQEAINNFAELFPNPANGTVTLRFNSKGNEPCEWVLTDVTGREYIKKNSIAIAGVNEFAMDISDLHTGVYFLKLKRPGSEIRKKFVKER